jgi:hypothetical protein
MDMGSGKIGAKKCRYVHGTQQYLKITIAPSLQYLKAMRAAAVCRVPFYQWQQPLRKVLGIFFIVLRALMAVSVVFFFYWMISFHLSFPN